MVAKGSAAIKVMVQSIIEMALMDGSSHKKHDNCRCVTTVSLNKLSAQRDSSGVGRDATRPCMTHEGLESFYVMFLSAVRPVVTLSVRQTYLHNLCRGEGRGGDLLSDQTRKVMDPSIIEMDLIDVSPPFLMTHKYEKHEDMLRFTQKSSFLIQRGLPMSTQENYVCIIPYWFAFVSYLFVSIVNVLAPCI